MYRAKTRGTERANHQSDGKRGLQFCSCSLFNPLVCFDLLLCSITKRTRSSLRLASRPTAWTTNLPSPAPSCLGETATGGDPSGFPVSSPCIDRPPASEKARTQNRDTHFTLYACACAICDCYSAGTHLASCRAHRVGFVCACVCVCVYL